MEDDSSGWVLQVVTPGPGLVFVAYPAAISEMDGAPIWSVLFFIMVICLGLDSQFCMVEVVVTTLHDMEKVKRSASSRAMMK